MHAFIVDYSSSARTRLSAHLLQDMEHDDETYICVLLWQLLV
jgi:hypothetical protein